jgi:hypothetical protein
MSEFEPKLKEIANLNNLKPGDKINYPPGTDNVAGVVSLWNGCFSSKFCMICESISLKNCKMCTHKDNCSAAMTEITDLEFLDLISNFRGKFKI